MRGSSQDHSDSTQTMCPQAMVGVRQRPFGCFWDRGQVYLTALWPPCGVDCLSGSKCLSFFRCLAALLRMRVSHRTLIIVHHRSRKGLLFISDTREEFKHWRPGRVNKWFVWRRSVLFFTVAQAPSGAALFGGVTRKPFASFYLISHPSKILGKSYTQNWAHSWQVTTAPT